MGTVDYNRLENLFYITGQERNDAVLSVSCADLLQEEKAGQFLEAYSLRLGTREPAVAATLFAAWFRAVCTASQYLISRCDAAADLSLRNLTVQLYRVKGRCAFAFVVRETQETPVPRTGREEWLHGYYARLYGDEVRPLFESLAKAACIDAGQLWGQLPSGMYHYQDLILLESENEDEKRKAERDFEYLVGIEPAVFGRKCNPFDVRFRMIDNPREPGRPLRVKSACCLAYRTDERPGYCYSCPRMNGKEREERRMAILAAGNK